MPGFPEPRRLAIRDAENLNGGATRDQRARRLVLATLGPLLGLLGCLVGILSTFTSFFIALQTQGHQTRQDQKTPVAWFVFVSA